MSTCNMLHACICCMCICAACAACVHVYVCYMRACVPRVCVKFYGPKAHLKWNRQAQCDANADAASASAFVSASISAAVTKFGMLLMLYVALFAHRRPTQFINAHTSTHTHTHANKHTDIAMPRGVMYGQRQGQTLLGHAACCKCLPAKLLQMHLCNNFGSCIRQLQHTQPYSDRCTFVFKWRFSRCDGSQAKIYDAKMMECNRMYLSKTSAAYLVYHITGLNNKQLQKVWET